MPLVARPVSGAPAPPKPSVAAPAQTPTPAIPAPAPLSSDLLPARVGGADDSAGFRLGRLRHPFRSDPTPHSRTRTPRWAVRLIILAAVALVGGTLALITSESPGGAPAHGTGAASLPPAATIGRVLVQNPGGALVLVDPGTDRAVQPAGVALLAGETVMTAPDRRFVATLQGAVLSIDANDQVHAAVTPRITQALLGGPATFAADDQAVIVVASNGGQLRTGQISALLFRNGSSVPLGSADEAAGDPQAIGAFVSVARPVPSNREPAGGYFGLPDSQVELRDAGHSARVLATAGQLNAALSQPSDRPVHMSLFPNPQGTAVAIVLNPPFGGVGDVGIVVLDRSGTVIGIVPPPSGPVEYSWPSWSPDGRSLVYPTIGSSGTELAIWRETGRPLLRTAPDNGAAFGYCLWAPNGSAVLCPTIQSARADWDEGAASGGPLFAVPAPGNPIVWLAPAPPSSPAEPATRHNLRRTVSF